MKVKAEGAIDTCQTCGTEVICVMKKGSGGYADKLQWQNKTGGAHYNYDFSKPEKERVSCNKPELDDAEQIVEEYEADHPLIVTGDATEQPKVKNMNHDIIMKQVSLLDDIDDVVCRHMPKAVDAKKGMYVKEIYRFISGGL